MKKTAFALFLWMSFFCSAGWCEDGDIPSEAPPVDSSSVPKKEEAASADEAPRNVKIKPMYDNNKLNTVGSPVEYKPRKSKVQTQEATIGTDGAAMYQRPNFDSQVMGYLTAGKKVLATRKMFHGEGGFGAFYKISANKKVGYVADTDLVLSASPSKSVRAAKKPDSPSPAREKVEQESETEREPIYFSRYLGLTIGQLNFTEKVAGSAYSSSELMYGLKFTGPDILFDSAPPMDINLTFHSGAPSLYNDVGAKGASGYFIFTDAVLLLPFNEWDNFLINYGLGVMFAYTSFKVPINGQVADSSNQKLGLVLDLGGAYRFSRYAARFDVKYYYESTSYLGYWAGIQMEY